MTSLCHAQLECNTFLVIEGDAAILIDAGVADEPYPAHLVANIKQALGPATLKLVICAALSAAVRRTGRKTPAPG